jgi:hypothetical protein
VSGALHVFRRIEAAAAQMPDQAEGRLRQPVLSDFGVEPPLVLMYM